MHSIVHIHHANYILKKYEIPITTTLKRISVGIKEKECIIKESVFRSIKSGCNKGRIKITDNVTGEKFYFFNTTDKSLAKMFSQSTVINGIKSGLPIGGKRSKYKNPCIIERITTTLTAS